MKKFYQISTIFIFLLIVGWTFWNGVLNYNLQNLIGGLIGMAIVLFVRFKILK